MKKRITCFVIGINEKISWKDHIEFKLQMGKMQLANVRNWNKRKGIRRKYARMVVWNTAVEASLYGAEICRKGRRKELRRDMTFFK